MNVHGFYRDKLIKRLIKKREILANGCWIWKGNVGNHGYGTTHFDGSIRLVHRLSAVIFMGIEIDSKKLVCHIETCKDKRCFNPSHLILKD